MRESNDSTLALPPERLRDIVTNNHRDYAEPEQGSGTARDSRPE